MYIYKKSFLQEILKQLLLLKINKKTDYKLLINYKKINSVMYKYSFKSEKICKKIDKIHKFEYNEYTWKTNVFSPKTTNV